MARAKKQKHLDGAEDVRRAAEVARKRLIVTDKFFPALVAASVSVDEAKQLLGATTALLMEDVLQTMKERKFEDVLDRLVKRLCPDGSREKEVEALLKILVGENLFVAREIVEGMTNAIDQMILEDMQSRTLNSFTPDWEKYLNR